MATAKAEFRLENERTFNRTGPVRWILSHVLRYPYIPLAAIAAAILNNILYSNVQVFIGRAFDLVDTPNWATTALLALAFSVMGIAAGQGITGLMRNWSVEFIAQLIERDAREELFVSLLGKSQTFHGRQRIGDIMARATNDVRTLNLMFSPGLMLILDSAMGTVIPLLLIGLIRLDLLLVPGIFLVFLAITLVGYNRQLNPVSQALREQFGKLNAGLAEAIGGIEVVKANTQEGREEERFVGDAGEYRDLFVRQGLIQARYLPWLVFSVAWGAAFLHAMLLWQWGGLTLGQVVTFMGLMGALRFPTFISIFTFNLVQLGVASARRILEMINTETELDENPGGISQPIQGAVTFEHVSFAYDGAPLASEVLPVQRSPGAAPALGKSSDANGAPVLKDISFAARPGETIAIVGTTGSGKTTLTRLINRIFDATAGRVLIDGVDVRDWNMESLRSQISTIEQDIFLFSTTLAENIAFGCPDADREAIVRAAEEAQAVEFIEHFPDGYETEVGERGVTLSGGQRQRIAIARAFLTNPRILILDDSTSAIDSATEDLIPRAMRRISRQRTTFLITHRLSQIRWADRILVLRRGELVDQGTHEELMERSVDYRRIFSRYD
jgi:ATP-binding cassette subfamily B protein